MDSFDEGNKEEKNRSDSHILLLSKQLDSPAQNGEKDQENREQVCLLTLQPTVKAIPYVASPMYQPFQKTALAKIVSDFLLAQSDGHALDSLLSSWLA